MAAKELDHIPAGPHNHWSEAHISSADGGGDHLYEVEIEPPRRRKNLTRCLVYANNRTQAASFAKRCGYIVRSVNMIW
jgi:hypothetical protein